MPCSLALIAAAEGDPGLKIATLYYSGCPLFRHVEYLQTDSDRYSLYESNSADPTPPRITPGMTMKKAVEQEDWDVILMHGGTFEPAYETTYGTGHIQTIQNYVNQHKKNPNAVFGWHMHWVFPTDPDLMALYPYTPNGYQVGYEKFGGGRKELYEAIACCMEKYILTDSTFRCLIPTGTAMESIARRRLPCRMSSVLPRDKCFKACTFLLSCHMALYSIFRRIGRVFEGLHVLCNVLRGLVRFAD